MQQRVIDVFLLLLQAVAVFWLASPNWGGGIGGPSGKPQAYFNLHPFLQITGTMLSLRVFYVFYDCFACCRAWCAFVPVHRPGCVSVGELCLSHAPVFCVVCCCVVVVLQVWC